MWYLPLLQQIQQRLLLFLVYYLLNILGPQTLVMITGGAAERPDDGDELESMEGELKDAARPEESFLHKWASFLISLQP